MKTKYKLFLLLAIFFAWNAPSLYINTDEPAMSVSVSVPVAQAFDSLEDMFDGGGAGGSGDDYCTCSNEDYVAGGGTNSGGGGGGGDDPDRVEDQVLNVLGDVGWYNSNGDFVNSNNTDTFNETFSTYEEALAVGEQFANPGENVEVLAVAINGVIDSYIVQIEYGSTPDGSTTVVNTDGSSTVIDKDGTETTTPLPGLTSFCSDTLPDLVTTDIFFVKADDVINNFVNSDKLIQGVAYDPVIQVENNSCVPTNTVNIFRNQMPYGEMGSFPVRARIDYGNNSLQQASSYDEVDFLFDQGPIGPDGRLLVRLPTIVINEPGTHQIQGSVDNFNITNNSCEPLTGNYNTPAGAPDPGDDWGCIAESNNTNNGRFENFTVIRPTLELGSFLMPDANTVSDVSNSSGRTINTGQQVGLYWGGDLIDFDSCTATIFSTNGATNIDFTGQNDVAGISSSLNSQLPKRDGQNDINIGEPIEDHSRIYTIECNIIGTISSLFDSVTINNDPVGDTVSEDIVALGPRVQDILIAPNQVGVTIDFEIENDSLNPVTGHNTSILIEGVRYSTVDQDNSLNVGAILPYTQTESAWTAPATAPDDRIPYSVCVNHPNMNIESCAGAFLILSGPEAPEPPELLYQCNDTIDNADPEDILADEEDPGCWDDPENPGTYNPDDDNETDTVANIGLGTYLIPDGNNITNNSWNPLRRIDEGDQVGLYWGGAQMDFSTCTGTDVNDLGEVFTSFTGQRDAGSLSSGQESDLNALGVNTSRIDINIGEPSGNRSRIFTITCNILNSSTRLSDSIVIATRTADLDDVVALAPRVYNITVPSSSSGIPISFYVDNNGPEGVSDYGTLLKIDNVDQGSVVSRPGSIPSVSTVPHTQSATTWVSPATAGVTPYSVCVRHDNMRDLDGSYAWKCAQGWMTVDDTLDPVVLPECSNGSNDDSDAWTDYPDDPGCAGPDDNSESPNPPPTPPQCVSFGVSPNSSPLGNQVTFTWETTGANSVSISNGVYSGSRVNGSQTFTPPATIGETTYTLTMTGSGGTATCPERTLGVTANPSIEAFPTIIRQGDDVEVWWDPGGGTGCTLNPISLFSGTPPANANGVRNESDPYVITPSGSTPLIYECNGVEDRVDIRVIPIIFET